MKLVKWILVAIILTHYLATCYACRFQQLVRRRRKDIAYRTRKLRPKMVDCFSSQVGDMYKSWQSIVDFVVLDAKWFKKTEDEICGKAAERNTATCWKESVKQLLRPNSTLLPIAFKCIDIEQRRRKQYKSNQGN
ncbi:uncharacterized protein LOC143449859 [Clavelina lepadiformis]|uniref:uncharacterized protein LOC143449859 n=1 Tax=Clavelina lepadiformis TaxID=159417 RepID=UPI0040414B5B